MARPRLITFTASGRLLGCSSTAEAMRAAWRGEVAELGYIIVERGNVGDVLRHLKEMEAAGE